MSTGSNRPGGIQSFLRVLLKVQDAISITCFIFMSIFVLAGVAMRFVLKIPFPWGEEMSRYLMVIAVMIGISMGVREKAHLGVTIFVDSVPKAFGKFLKMLGALFSIAAFALLSFLSCQFILSNYQFGQRSPALNIPMYMLYGVLLLGFLLSFLEAAIVFYFDFIAKKPELYENNEGGVQL